MLPKSHGECRASLCIGCHKLGSTLRKVSPKSTLLEKVQQQIYDGFSLENTSLPNVICDGCRRTVLKGKFKKKLEYDMLTRMMPRGQSDERCQCYICQMVSSNKNLKHLPNHSPQKRLKFAQNKAISKPVKVCPKCKQHVGKGIRHHCTPGKEPKNISKLAKSKDVKEKVASSLLSEMTPNKDGDVALKTGGRKLRVRLKPKDREANILTHNQMDKFHSKVTKRNKKSDLLGQGLRKVYGRKSVQPYYRQHREEKKKKAASFLDIINLSLQGRDDTKIACVVKNSRDFIEHMKIQRGVTNAHVKIGWDGGKKWEKGTAQLQDKDEKPPSSESCDLFEGDFKDTGKYILYKNPDIDVTLSSLALTVCWY